MTYCGYIWYLHRSCKLTSLCVVRYKVFALAEICLKMLARTLYKNISIAGSRKASISTNWRAGEFAKGVIVCAGVKLERRQDIFRIFETLNTQRTGFYFALHFLHLQPDYVRIAGPPTQRRRKHL